MSKVIPDEKSLNEKKTDKSNRIYEIYSACNNEYSKLLIQLDLSRFETNIYCCRHFRDKLK